MPHYVFLILLAFSTIGQVFLLNKRHRKMYDLLKIIKVMFKVIVVVKYVNHYYQTQIACYHFTVNYLIFNEYFDNILKTIMSKGKYALLYLAKWISFEYILRYVNDITWFLCKLLNVHCTKPLSFACILFALVGKLYIIRALILACIVYD